MELDVPSAYFDCLRSGVVAAMLGTVLCVVAPATLAKTGGEHRSTYASGVARDSHGRIKRNPQARRDFQKSHPCPSTGKTSGACPGYVVDHVRPLKRGGADAPSNMQWQTVQAAKEKDR